MKLLSLEIGLQFRSLHPGFQVHFHKLTDKGVESMLEFQPFCFAGLNGSGKSNVLEALAAIFYHLEMCVARYRPDSFNRHFDRSKSAPDDFTLKYIINEPKQASLVSNSANLKYLARLVTISKLTGKEPEMIVDPNPFKIESIQEESRRISLESSVRSQERAPGKEFLPDLVVGYSSGENEILSLPFIKNRLIHFDEYKEAVKKGLPFDEPETSLIYIDKEMSQAVLLACMLFEDENTLKPLKDELGILGIQSFRMNLNLLKTGLPDKKDSSIIKMIPLIDHLEEKIELLKKCSTSWYKSKKGLRVDPQDKEADRLTLDFFVGVDTDSMVDSKTRQIFKDNFDSSFDFFRLLQVLYELNNNIVSDSIKEEVYMSEGFYTDGKLPSASPEDNVFYFLDYLILKQIDDQSEPKELLLREFSDGEHQFLHTMGICLMLKDRRTLLLLDEPETHFNPKWRAEFIKILNSIIKASGTNNFLKDVLLSSHSPFIISDCMPDNVLFFTRNDSKKLEVKNAAELGLKTYGSSIDYILKNFFDTYLISSKSLGEMKDIIDHGTIDELRDAVESFGESSQKQFLFKKIFEKMEKKDDN